MKKIQIMLFLVFTGLFSCKKESSEPLAVPTVEEEMVVNEFQITCYQGIMKKDTINLQLRIGKNQEVTGELAYLFYEKDKSNGTIVGKMFGDTLKADYTFSAEGKQNIREVVFLRKGKIVIEAYGEVEEREGKTVHKEPKKLYFDSATILTEVDCVESK